MAAVVGLDPTRERIYGDLLLRSWGDAAQRVMEALM